MFIKDTSKIDLGTIDLCIEAGNRILSKVPTLDIPQDAKDAWVHEMTASNERLTEMREGYTDGRVEARHHKDRVVMLMHASLCQKFVGLLPEPPTE